MDSGRPVFTGVNEAGEASYKDAAADPSKGLQNDGVTDHFLLDYGYRMDLVNGNWQITKLLAIDNAAGGSLDGRYPEFNVSKGQIRKPATCAHPASALASIRR